MDSRVTVSREFMQLISDRVHLFSTARSLRQVITRSVHFRRALWRRRFRLGNSNLDQKLPVSVKVEPTTFQTAVIDVDKDQHLSRLNY